MTVQDKSNRSLSQSQKVLSIDGGTAVRSEPLPLEFPGVHHMDDEEVLAVTRIVRSRSLFRYYGVDLQGEVAAFEADFARFLGVPHALAVTSGTGALHVALSALGVGPGQEIIIPAYLWVSVVAAVVNLGAIPVLADIDDTFCLDPLDVQRRITSRTTGIIAVHMSGAPADSPALLKLARGRGLFLLEDCAQCAGGSIGGKKVGTFGDMGIFSFQMNKNMSSGEGGCVVTNSQRLYQRALAGHDTGFARDADGRAILDNPDLSSWGRGYRLDELRAAVLRVQLKKLPSIIAHMRGSKYRVRKELEKYPQLHLRRIVDTEGDTGCFLIVTFADNETVRKVSDALRGEGICTSPQGVNNVVMTDWGLHIYSNIVTLTKRAAVDKAGFPWKLTENQGSTPSYSRGTCPVADDLFERSLLLAIPSCLTEKDELDIIHAFDKVLNHFLVPASTKCP
jgi:dTDP-4-amino-4,6-dideoxygalactose transaminase